MLDMRRLLQKSTGSEFGTVNLIDLDLFDETEATLVMICGAPDGLADGQQVGNLDYLEKKSHACHALRIQSNVLAIWGNSTDSATTLAGLHWKKANMWHTDLEPKWLRIWSVCLFV